MNGGGDGVSVVFCRCGLDIYWFGMPGHVIN